MSPLESARQHARSVRYAERVRWEERLRAFDLIELRVPSEGDEAVAVALYEAAADIMRAKG